MGYGNTVETNVPSAVHDDGIVRGVADVPKLGKCRHLHNDKLGGVQRDMEGMYGKENATIGEEPPFVHKKEMRFVPVRPKGYSPPASINRTDRHKIQDIQTAMRESKSSRVGNSLTARSAHNSRSSPASTAEWYIGTSRSLSTNLNISLLHDCEMSMREAPSDPPVKEKLNRPAGKKKVEPRGKETTVRLCQRIRSASPGP
ncbi:hypothetical protein B0H16DRAFT_1485744 [Mycena metata]|uniref:Uncharacterized protein n=1 Tax=Mycena metata TaxID=1033252 RepID=A0AAD7DLN9_9AGAR|nr:hypothetical protein B0H16DRAFT_1485744 [Mycena metata]